MVWCYCAVTHLSGNAVFEHSVRLAVCSTSYLWPVYCVVNTTFAWNIEHRPWLKAMRGRCCNYHCVVNGLPPRMNEVISDDACACTRKWQMLFFIWDAGVICKNMKTVIACEFYLESCGSTYKCWHATRAFVMRQVLCTGFQRRWFACLFYI